MGKTKLTGRERYLQIRLMRSIGKSYAWIGRQLDLSATRVRGIAIKPDKLHPEGRLERNIKAIDRWMANG